MCVCVCVSWGGSGMDLCWFKKHPTAGSLCNPAQIISHVSECHFSSVCFQCRHTSVFRFVFCFCFILFYRECFVLVCVCLFVYVIDRWVFHLSWHFFFGWMAEKHCSRSLLLSLFTIPFYGCLQMPFVVVYRCLFSVVLIPLPWCPQLALSVSRHL